MKSKILDAVHHTATVLRKSGTITDATMRGFDKLCLLACKGDSHWTFFDGNYQEYEADKRKRLGDNQPAWLLGLQPLTNTAYPLRVNLVSVVCSLSRMARREAEADSV